MCIKLIDSSIRDGGNVNDWNFGKRVIQGIVENLRDSQIDVIELGYLRNVVYDENRSLYNSVSDAKKNIPLKAGNEEYSLMIQEDKWDWNNLEPCDGTIKHIRVSFHKYDINEGLELCRIVKENGYICHCNPIHIMGYNDKELLDLIDQINMVHPDVFTIVDTFGSMFIDDIKRINSLLQNNLLSEICIAAHLHENLGLAYSLAQEFILYFENKRDIFIDASLFGIGRVPGNLCLELIMNYLNREKMSSYNIDYIYDAIDDFISGIKLENPWGYAVPYALSSMYNLHRTYAEFLMDQRNLKTKDIRAILESVVPDERVIYNQEYIKQLYNNYLNINVDDTWVMELFADRFKDENILILAPGKSILEWKEVIRETVKKYRCIVISINFKCDFLESDYVFFTNPKRYSYEKINIKEDDIIITSNLLHNGVTGNYIINYLKISNINGKNIKDSVLFLLNFLRPFNCGHIYIAGFDGFEEGRNHFDKAFDNAYYDPEHTKNVKWLLKEYFKDIKLSYITPTIYDKDV